ncbi:MAG: hypothetical protein LBI20_00925 [Holosporales bacterium]|jgi:hypothetical protein|nr:hypothetical protein [Holosporales bacterium]
MSSIEISPIERISILTQLIIEFEKGLRALDAVRYAKDLASVIDELNLHEIDLGQLRQEFTSYFPEHWKRRTNFLLIVTNFWPEILRELGKIDLKPIKNRECFHLPLREEESEILTEINIFEANDILHEIQFIVSTVRSNKHQNKITIVSPDEDISNLLRFRFETEDIKYISARENNEDFDKKKVISEIEKYFGNMILENDHEFMQLVSELSTLYLSDKLNWSAGIILLDNISLATQAKSDITICTAMNEMSWYSTICDMYWLHQFIRQKIGLPTVDDLKKRVEADFYNVINSCKEVFLTRSKEVKKTNTQKCSILAKLEMYCKRQKLNLNYCDKEMSYHQLVTEPTNNFSVNNFIIPERLGVSSLALLMKNPYDFFAKHSLGVESTDVDYEFRKMTAAFRELIKIYFCDKEEIWPQLEIIKQIDFFYYQKCLSMIEWLASNYQEIDGECDIRGSTVIGDSGIELYGYVDRIENYENYAVLSYFYALFNPPTIREILYGDDCSILATCLIAEKNGFPEINVPIREVRIYSPALNDENAAFSVKSLEISRTLIQDFENQINKFLGQFSTGEYKWPNVHGSNASSYWHLERRIR